MPSLKLRDVIRILKRHGFEEIRTRGSHSQFEAVIDGRRRLVTVQTNHLNQVVRPGTLTSIIRQSGLRKKDFNS